MSIDVMALVFKIENISPLTKLVLLAFADRADDKGGQLFPSKKYIAKRSSCSERQVQRIMQKLKILGVLKIIRKQEGRTTPHYQLDLTRLTTSCMGGDTMSPQDGETTKAVRGDNGGRLGETPCLPNPLRDSSVVMLADKKLKTKDQDVVDEKTASRLLSEDKTKKYCPEKYRGEILPYNWQGFAESLDIPNETIFKSWRRFKEYSTWPMIYLKWKTWCEREAREKMHSTRKQESEALYD
jgi:hypothetical protein